MGKDKVIHPQNRGSSGLKQAKSGVVEGPTASLKNLTPYNSTKRK